MVEQQCQARTGERPAIPRRLVSVESLCAAFCVSARWVYKHSRKECRDPLVRLGRSLRFDLDKVDLYLRSRERHSPGASLISSDTIARVSRQGKYKLVRKRFQTGSVRLREDRGPAYWQGFHRESHRRSGGNGVQTCSRQPFNVIRAEPRGHGNPPENQDRLPCWLALHVGRTTPDSHLPLKVVERAIVSIAFEVPHR